MKEVWRCSYTTRSNKETFVQWLETPEERDAYLAVAPTAGNPVAVRYVQADQPAPTETGPKNGKCIMCGAPVELISVEEDDRRALARALVPAPKQKPQEQ